VTLWCSFSWPFASIRVFRGHDLLIPCTLTLNPSPENGRGTLDSAHRPSLFCFRLALKNLSASVTQWFSFFWPGWHVRWPFASIRVFRGPAFLFPCHPHHIFVPSRLRGFLSSWPFASIRVFRGKSFLFQGLFKVECHNWSACTSSCPMEGSR
jgi:hypothetical protein